MQYIKEITQEQETTIFCGWISKIRASKAFSFWFVRDGSLLESQIQVVVPTELSKGVSLESYVKIVGKVKQLPPKQYSHKTFEIHADEVYVIGPSVSDFASRCPLDAGPEVRQTERHLYLRTQVFALTTKIRAILLKSLRKTFEKMDCTEVVPPQLTGVECESGASTYELDYHYKREGVDMKAYLTQSSQFYLEYAVPGLGDTYCIADSFRAESSHTRRHLTEFSHAEAEFSRIFTMDDHIEKLKVFLQLLFVTFKKYSKQALLDYDSVCKTKISEHIDEIIKMTHDIKLMRHSEAIQWLRDHEIYKDPEQKIHFELGDDIPEAQERKLIDSFPDKITFLTHFPIATKSFYMMADPEDETLALGVDVEFPGVGECIGSGVREGDPTVLLKRMKGMKVDDYTEYFDLRKYGFGKTSGFGLGIDRLLSWILQSYHIRDVVTFPRYPGHLRP